jgi:hypothetical protein
MFITHDNASLHAHHASPTTCYTHTSHVLLQGDDAPQMRTTSFPLLNGTVSTSSHNYNNNNNMHSQYDLPVQWASINDVSATSAMSTAVPTAKRFRFSDLNYDSSYYQQQQQQSLAATTSSAAATLAAMAASSGNNNNYSSSSGHSTVFGQQMNSGYGGYYSSGGYNSGSSYTSALLPFGAHYAPAFEPAACMVPTACYPEHPTGNTAIAGGDTITTSAATTAAGEGGLQFDGCVYGQIPEKPLLGSWCSHFDSLYVNDITDIALF